jgi:hypothetical protein
MAAEKFTVGTWSGGLAEWRVERVVYLSVAFTWRIDEAISRAVFWRAAGNHVIAGGPALFLPKLRARMAEVAELAGDFPDAIGRHNSQATVASRGCPVGCWFCIVPKMEGEAFTLLPDFEPRPVLCDNNLSALPAEYQDHIIRRYHAAGVPLLDANSGFEPRTFTDEVFARWRPINRGAWRFAYDDTPEGKDVERVMIMLRGAGVRPRRMQVYTLIGNEPFEACMTRINQVIRWGGEPYAQPVMKLNALDRRPIVRFDWSEQRLRQVQRWCNYSRRSGRPFEEYDPKARAGRGRDTETLELFASAGGRPRQTK